LKFNYEVLVYLRQG
jgi:cilia- and flagella-associated protein 43